MHADKGPECACNRVVNATANRTLRFVLRLHTLAAAPPPPRRSLPFRSESYRYAAFFGPFRSESYRYAASFRSELLDFGPNRTGTKRFLAELRTTFGTDKTPHGISPASCPLFRTTNVSAAPYIRQRRPIRFTLFYRGNPHAISGQFIFRG